MGTPADGLQEFRRVLGAADVRRWPMYLRNVKQIFRQASPVYDERTYGYASLVDLLRAAQKEGLVRLERDRQGIVRVFQGVSVTMPTHPPSVPTQSAEPGVPVGLAVESADTAEPDLSTGPGNSISDLSAVPEVRRRRPRPAAARPRGPASRRPHKKPE